MPTGLAEKSNDHATEIDLTVGLGRLRLPNPVLVASGTFGYAREMAPLIDLGRLGGILPKTVTAEPRQGNAPWRTVETAAGMLNAIGLDNDGADAFIECHLPYLASLGSPIIVSVAGRTAEDFVGLCRRFGETDATIRPAAIELNLSCPNVSGGVDFGSDPAMCEGVVRDCVAATDLPILAKLTPNVTSVPTMAKAAEAGGCDAITLINTVLGLGIDWRNRRPLLANVVGGLSGPAIKPIALRCVYQAAQAVRTPIVGVGGAATIDDVMEFLVAGASAVQLGTVNFYRPTAAEEVLDALPAALAELGVSSVADAVGCLVTADAGAKKSPSPEGGGARGGGESPPMPAVRRRVAPKARANATKLRREATVPEQRLWEALRARQLSGLKFRRQQPIESFVVDFCCSDTRLIVEVDGESHDGQAEYDTRRQARLESLGYCVLRVSNDDVLNNLDGVLESILRAARSGGADPSPNPSP